MSQLMRTIGVKGAAGGAAYIDVAVAVLQRPDGQVLWCQRPPGKPYAGYWEFPGGKVEPGESVWQALVREIQEELGLVIREGGFWFLIEHDYPHAKVRLHLYRVWEFDGEPQAREGQAFCWDTLDPQYRQRVTPILPATEPILSRLALPSWYILSAVDQVGLVSFCTQIERFYLRYGSFLLQFREFNLSAREQVGAFEVLRQFCFVRNILLVVHAACEHVLRFVFDKGVQRQFGIHWPQRLLSSNDECLDVKSWALATASAHDISALDRAFDRGAHAAVIGSVHVTKSHPERLSSLGWQGFSNIAIQAHLPVYAIGGMSVSDLLAGRRAGAHGLAFRSAVLV